MIRLLLIRHAKSSWKEPGLADRDRPLNKRGRRAAPAIGGWVLAKGLVPGHGLVSTAVRARETWAGLCREIGEVPASYEPALYEATPEAMLAVLRRAPAVATLAVVGHQPGIGEMARRLVTRAPETAEFRKYPTAATAVIVFDASDWREVGWGSGRLAEFMTPKRLARSDTGAPLT